MFIVTDKSKGRRGNCCLLGEVVPRVVYYESINREIKRNPIYEYRYDERLKTKGIYTTHMYWVGRGSGTTKDRDEVNRREVCECYI